MGTDKHESLSPPRHFALTLLLHFLCESDFIAQSGKPKICSTLTHEMVRLLGCFCLSHMVRPVTNHSNDLMWFSLQ